MTTSISNSFIPKPPEFTQSFFEPESPIIESPPPQMPIQPLELLTTNPPSALNFITANISTKDLALYQNFLDQCVFNYTYEPSPFGTICPGHPDAQYPYPGPMPENPHADKTVIGLFIQRGISKTIREEERTYKDALRHWEAQMNHHILEVPSLIAKDMLLQSYVALLHNNTEEAIQLAHEALQIHPFNADALALLVIAHFQKGDLKAALHAEARLLPLSPPLPLNATGQLILDNIIQIALLETYKNACTRTLNQLDDLNLAIPMEKGFLKNTIQAHLDQGCSKRFGVEAVDFLDLIALYFIDEMVSEQPVHEELSKNIENHFPHLARMFENIEQNIILIAEANHLPKFPTLQLLQDSFDKKLSQDKAWVKQLIEELSHPVSFGDTYFKRQFMLNAMKIQLEKALFELGPSLKELPS